MVRVWATGLDYRQSLLNFLPASAEQFLNADDSSERKITVTVMRAIKQSLNPTTL